MASPSAITLLFLLVLIPFATASPSAASATLSAVPIGAPSAAPLAITSATLLAAPSAVPPSVAPSTSSSVEFSEISVSQHEDANRKRDITIDGNCRDVKCCGNLCKEQIRYAKTVNVAYRFINGKHQCLCSVICNDKSGACAP